MSRIINWGILGCGKIARKFAADLALVKEAKLLSVGARSKESGSAFAKEFSVPNIHSSYKALMDDSAVDVIYVATPHALHHEHVMLCLTNNKAVLCEKAFSINLREANEMIELAQSKKLFLMEAFWTRFLPHYRKVKDLITAGKIGNIKYLHAEFGFKPTPPVSQRIFDPALGGGSLLDIGVYPVFLALDLLGKPDQITASIIPTVSGVDDQCSIHFKYKSGALATLFSTFATNLATGADIAGDQGRLRLTHRFHGPTTSLEYYSGAIDTRQEIEFEKAVGNGYEYEASHVTECIQKGLIESPIRKHADTLLLMETLDEIRKMTGITYPADK